ncbi:phosphatase PAP2 family protein [Flavobacterium sp. LMO8]|uniref:phosphatase PAP2 family protein n=1 Tax=Flavobacterium sp. LMO8 TaxID=2654244 RepID=UPI00129110A5|nr:phosphatase PAP2 family protein [Flavobacterium sp. LMO8]MQP25426.1 phosphatase PAP2 family protein [Flavobacterium sp. LMO8]
MEQLINLDKELFLFLNGLGSEPFDGFWKIITKQLYWSPLFVGVFYLLQKKVGWKGLGIIILFLAALITFTDQITNLFKYSFERLRPCNNPEFDGIIREVITRKSFSFFSGHAANSMASTMFIFLIVRKYYKFAYLLFLFSLIFAYSRIYLGLHYPADIVTGYVFGGFFGFSFYKLYCYINNRYKINSEIITE